MALDTFDELKTAVGDWLDRDDLTSHVETFIRLAEARHQREIRIREMQERATLAIAEDDRYVALPDDFLDLKYLRIQTPTTTSGRAFLPDLTEITQEEITQKSIKDAKRPHSFVVWEDTIEFDCIMDQDYTAELFYYTELDALSDLNPSNALLARAPDAYLYAALAESAPFLLNDERIPVWEGRYALARDTLNPSERMSRRGGPLTVRLAGSTP